MQTLFRRIKTAIFFGMLAMLATACQFGSDIAFQSNAKAASPLPTPTPTPTPVSFTQNFDFNTASQYTYDATKIDFTNGIAELTASYQNDNSNSALGFAGGTLNGVAWDSGTNPNAQFLRLSESGTPTNNSALDASWTPEWSSLIAYWPLDGNGPIAYGATIPAVVGTAGTATVNTQPTYIQGKIGQALNMPGDGGTYLTLPVPNIDTTPGHSITVSFWVYYNWAGSTTDSAGFMPIYFGNYDLEFKDLNNGLFGFNNENADIWGINGYQSMENTWTHVVAVFNNGAMTNNAIYLNGVPQTLAQQRTNTSPNDSVSSPLGISYPSWPFNGGLDELAIWNKALTASEVQMIYNRQSAKYAGTFTSRVMDGLETTANWTNFSWVPTLPFFKELPDTPLPTGTATPSPVSETSANYSSLIDATTTPSTSKNLMNGIVGLWHLDEASGAGTAYDYSGNGNNGTIESGVTMGGGGKLGTSATFNGSGYINVPNTNGNFSFGTGDFTFSTWFNSTNAGTIVALGMYDSTAGFWFAIQNGEPIIVGVNGSAQSPIALNDGKWHHMVGVRASGILTIYADGVAMNSASSTGNISAAGYLGIGKFGRDQTYYWTGSLDEVGIWNRALSANEILELYRRGANRIKYQVRSCTAVDCSDDASNANWKGPDNTNQSYFSELNNNLVQKDGGDLTSSDSVSAALPALTFANFTGLTIPTKRYFQYRAIMESDDTSTNCNYGGVVTWCSPELKSVSVGPGHYDTSAPTITNKTGLSYVTLATLVETLGASACSSGTLYNLSPDNVNWYYWTGAAFGLADGTTGKANAASVITGNLRAFSMQFGSGTLYFKAFLQSSGTSACAIDNLLVTGTHYGGTQ